MTSGSKTKATLGPTDAPKAPTAAQITSAQTAVGAVPTFSTTKNQSILSGFGFTGTAGPTGNGGKGGEGAAFVAALPYEQQLSYAVQRIAAGDSTYQIPTAPSMLAPASSGGGVAAPTLTSPEVSAASAASQKADGGIINRAPTMLTDEDIKAENQDPLTKNTKSLLGE